MPRAARGRATRSTRSPATFSLDGHIIETYNHIDDLPQLSSLPKKRPRHATRGATAAERRADRQAAAASEPHPNGMVTRSSRQNLLRHSNSTSPLTAPSPSSEPTDNDYPPISCRVCFKSNTPTKIICCSICRKGVHTFCLNPPVMDLPNDSSWKCSKCRRTRLPLKKEARIILRDALSTYSPLCTDNYINAVASVVCVVSDSESPHNKNPPNPPKNPKPDPPHKPPQPPPNDNTVVLRLSTDDSDLDSNVEDDIRPNPAANSDKPQPSRPSNQNEASKQQQPTTDPSNPVEKNSSPGKKNSTQEEQAPSSSTSFDGDDERPLSQLMSRSKQRRHRHTKPLKPKQTDPTLASPKMRIKAKQRRLREESVERLQLVAGADMKAVREPTSLPPKRRGRKPGVKKVEKIAQETPPQVSGNSEKDTNAKSADQTKQVEITAQPIAPIPPATAEPIEMDVKPNAIKEEVIEPSTAPGNEQNKDTRDAPSEMSDGSASNIDEGYPGDTEDDLPLSKRSARYRKPSSPRSNKDKNDKPSLQATNEGPVMKESPPATVSPVNNACDREPKQEAIIQDTTTMPENRADEVDNPKSAAVGEVHPGTPADNPEANPDLEKQSSGSWPQMKLDPKHEALFALARVQRQQPKPTDSSENPVVSLESESSAGASKALPRPKNIPESERQRIQVTALAASNMRRNVSNMASTMAGLRPHSPHVSKGSINLLLQQNQPEAHSDTAAQRSYQPAQDINTSRHSGHQGREEVIQSGPDPHRSDREIARNSAQVYRTIDPRSQEARSSGTFPYRDAPAGGDIQAYSMPQHRNVAQNGAFRVVEPEVPPFAKRNRVEEMLPQAKRPRNNKSDISNVLSTDSLIPMNERQIMNKNIRMPRIFPEPGHRTPQQAPAPLSTVQGHSSDRQTQPNQAPGPYSLSQSAPQNRFEPPEARPNNFGMRERLTLQEARMSHNDEGNLGARFPPTGAPYPSIPPRNSVAQAESGMQMNREEEARHATHRAYDSNRGLIPQVQESSIRTSPQAYAPSNIGGDPIPSRLRWPDNKEPAVNAQRQVYSGTNTTNQPWSDSRVSSRPPQQEGPYNAAVNRFVPIDRRTRRPMPYVPTATRKAQFEQGRALAFIDSRPSPPNAEPSETYRMDDRSPGLTTKPYATRPEGTYSGSEYAFPQSGHGRTTYADEESRTHPNPYHRDYYAHRQEYRRSSNSERVNEGGPYTGESQRDSLMRENIGSNTRVVDGAVYDPSRLSAHQHGQPSSGTILEPPLERNKSLALDRNEALSFSSLVGPRVRARQENEMPSITSTFGSERRPPGTGARPPMETGQSERGYGTGRIHQTSDRRTGGFSDIPYGSFHSQRNEAMRPPPGSIVDARLPAPIHVDGDHYRSRDTTVDPAERRFPSSVMVPSGSGSVYGRRADQIGNRYDYSRGSQEARGSIMPQGMAALDNRNEEFGADRVSNIPLVARFDNSLGGYMDSKTIGRRNDRESRMSDVPIMHRNDQGQQLPSLRSNPSLRDLLS